MFSLSFTHNLQIKLFNMRDEIMSNKNLLDIIKDDIIKKTNWKKIQLTNIQMEFMGNLFCNFTCDPENDFILYIQTEKTLNEIKKKYNITEYNIKFYISRLPISIKPYCDQYIIYK